ncbi:mitochondrial ribonuclease P catalytic subunit isoform X2 [Ceratina calcarata]|uniref:Mitochondrial ribonuclease P catalytic subunit n=1 Tax=Ceratina calcarata TaxID=156304 RepID=A0AAJ7WD52_9HYME|nr:mitochondrial ribonuclease P catalytic subunit isoform X2 [Ceratina calcarata]
MYAMKKNVIRNASNITAIYKKKEFFDFCGAWKEKFSEVLVQPDNVPKETWENMRRYVMDSEFKPLIVDTFVLQMCINEKYPQAGISYYKFLESNNYKPSVSTLSTYLKLYGMRDDPLTKGEKEHVLSICKNISNTYTSLNSELANVLVRCLCQVGEWQEAVKIIENYKENHLHIRDAVSNLISYFYENGKEDLGRKYLVASLKTSLGPSKFAYDSYLKHCLKEKDKFNERIENLFILWNKYGLKPVQRVVLEISNACNQSGWSVVPTTISRSTCAVCKQLLARNDLNDEEYERLRQVTLKKLISEGMYYVTDPKEIQHYVRYIDQRKPYDVIVDGLNIFYSNRGIVAVSDRRWKNFFSYLIFDTFQLVDSIKYYKRWGKKILVIGRYHLKKMIMRLDIRDMADYFYVHDWSKDDVFLLYAAFSSGKDTVVISKDLMRQHKFAMKDPELDALFKKWQASHQYTTVTLKGSGTQLDDQIQVNAMVQKKNDCWHVPYVDYDMSVNKTRIGNNEWFCFKMPRDKK